MIADDDELCLLSLSDILNQLGVEDVEMVHDGKEATEWIENRIDLLNARGKEDAQPGIVFLDNMMPFITGE